MPDQDAPRTSDLMRQFLTQMAASLDDISTDWRDPPVDMQDQMTAGARDDMTKLVGHVNADVFNGAAAGVILATMGLSHLTGGYFRPAQIATLVMIADMMLELAK